MQGSGADKIRPQFQGCPANNPVTIPICNHGYHTNRSTPHNFRNFFPVLDQRHVQIYFSTGTKLKDSSIPRHYAMSIDNCYWPFKKSVPSSSRSVSMALDHKTKKLHFSKTAVKTSNLTGTKYNPHTYTHWTILNIYLQHMMLQEGESHLQAGTDLQEHILHHCFEHIL